MRNFFTQGDASFAEHRLTFFAGPDAPQPEIPDADAEKADTKPVDMPDLADASSTEVGETAAKAEKKAEQKTDSFGAGLKAEKNSDGSTTLEAKIKLTIPGAQKLVDGFRRFTKKGEAGSDATKGDTQTGQPAGEAPSAEAKADQTSEPQAEQKESVDTLAALQKDLALQVDTIRELANGGATDDITQVVERMNAAIANANFEEGQQVGAEIVDAVAAFPIALGGKEYTLSFDGSQFSLEEKKAPEAKPAQETPAEPNSSADVKRSEPIDPVGDAPKKAKPAQSTPADAPTSRPADARTKSPRTETPVRRPDANPSRTETPAPRSADAQRNRSGSPDRSAARTPDRGSDQREPQATGVEQRERILSPREALVRATQDAMRNDPVLSGQMQELFSDFGRMEGSMPPTYEALRQAAPKTFYTMEAAHGTIHLHAFNIGMSSDQIEAGRKTIHASPQGTYAFMKEVMAGFSNSPVRGPGIARGQMDRAPQASLASVAKERMQPQPDTAAPTEQKTEATSEAPDQGSVDTLKSVLGKLGEFVKTQVDGSIVIDLSKATENPAVRRGFELALGGLGIETKDGKIAVTKGNIDSLIAKARQLIDLVDGLAKKEEKPAAQPKSEPKDAPEGPAKSPNATTDLLKQALGPELAATLVTEKDGSMKIDLSKAIDNDFAKMAIPYVLDALNIQHADGKISITVDNMAKIMQAAPKIQQFMNAVRSGSISELPQDMIQAILDGIDKQLPEKMRGKLKLENLNITFELGEKVAKSRLATLALQKAGIDVRDGKAVIEPRDIAAAIAVIKTLSRFFPDRQEEKQ